MGIGSTKYKAENIPNTAALRRVNEAQDGNFINRPSETISIPNYFQIHLQLPNRKTARSRK